MSPASTWASSDSEVDRTLVLPTPWPSAPNVSDSCKCSGFPVTFCNPNGRPNAELLFGSEVLPELLQVVLNAPDKRFGWTDLNRSLAVANRLIDSKSS